LKLNFSYEIIVVDNASGDGCDEMIENNFPEARFIQSSVNGGMGAGNNLGIKAAQGKYILVLNPDTTVLEGAIEKMLQFLAENEKVGLVGPRLINPDGTTQMSAYQLPKFFTPLFRRTFFGRTGWGKKIIREYLMEDWDHETNRPVGWVMGSAMMLKKEAIEKVGIFDERFFMYLEDTDWCRRFWEKGWAVYYIHDAEVVHYHERLTAQSGWIRALFKGMTWIHIASWLKYFAKYWGARSPR